MLFGVLFSLLTRKESAGVSVFSSHYFWHGLVFSTLFNAIVLYSTLKFPDWMWMYFVEAPQLGMFDLAYIFFFLYYLPYGTGFYLGRDLLKRYKSAVWLLILFLMAVEAWVVWKLFDRYEVIGTRQQFLDGTAISLFSPQNPIGPVMNGGVALMIIYYLTLWWKSRRN